MRIDAHQHFWRLDRGDYGWLTPAQGAIYRDFLPADLAPLLVAAGIEGTILVQAAPSVAETAFLLALAAEHDFIKGVVGWVDFESPDAAAQIDRLAAQPALIGLRPMIQDIPDPDWMLRADMSGAFEAMIADDLTFDALTLPRHLPALRRLVERYPDLRVVIDHGSKPDIATGEIEGWAADMAALAAHERVFCKLSGLVTEAAPDWTVDDLRPFVDHLRACFGPQRLIWGSDWPVCTRAASYANWVAATDSLLAGESDEARAAIFGDTAVQAYRLVL